MPHLADSMTRKAGWLVSGPWRICMLFIASIVVYANTWNNGYVLDDTAVITRNTIVTKGIPAIPEIFTTPYLHGYTQNPNDLYRPLPLAMFAAEYQLFDASPVAGHLINILFFAGCVIALFLFLDALFEGQRTTVAWMAALLFACHPIHTEVVANIKSRDELLCFFFAFLSLVAFLKYHRSGKIAALGTGGLCYFLSLLSKETSITFLLVIPFVFFFFRDNYKKRSRYITALAFVAAIIFLVLRIHVLNSYHANHPFQVSVTENSLAGASSIAARLATAILILGMYLKQLFIPYPLISDYSYNSIPLSSFADHRVIISLGLYFSLLAITLFRLIKKRNDLFAFAIFFYLITLSLFSNIPFLVGATMAERFLFFPSVGFCLCLALGVEKGVRKNQNSIRSAPLTLATALLLIYGCIAFFRNRDWRDNITLYKSDLQHEPNSYRLYYYLGTELVNAGTYGDADTAANNKLLRDGIDNLKKSIAIYPRFAVVYAEAGDAYMQLGQYDSSARYNLTATQLNPKDTFSMNKLAGAYFKLGKYHESVEQCEKIIAIDPTYARAYRNIGACYLKMEKYDAAVPILRTAIQLDPNISSPYGFMAITFNRLGNNDSAKKYEALAQQFNPDFKVE